MFKILYKLLVVLLFILSLTCFVYAGFLYSSLIGFISLGVVLMISCYVLDKNL